MSIEQEIAEMNKQPAARPWQIVREQVSCKYGPVPNTQIFTAWDHPQLEGPAPVVNLAFSLSEDGKSLVYTVSIRDTDADFIVKACNEHDALVADATALAKAMQSLLKCDLIAKGEICGQCHSSAVLALSAHGAKYLTNPSEEQGT